MNIHALLFVYTEGSYRQACKYCCASMPSKVANFGNVRIMHGRMMVKLKTPQCILYNHTCTTIASFCHI